MGSGWSHNFPINTQLIRAKSRIEMQVLSQKDSTDTENKLTVARWKGVGGLGEKGEGIKYKLIVRKPSLGCKVQHSEYSQ